MNYLRQAHFLARIVLAWFVLSVGVAMASPLVVPKSMDMVCSTGGVMKFISSDDAQNTVATVKTMDCALCMPVVFPPASTALPFIQASPLAHALQPLAAAHIAVATAPPLPSRGPPSL